MASFRAQFGELPVLLRYFL